MTLHSFIFLGWVLVAALVGALIGGALITVLCKAKSNKRAVRKGPKDADNQSALQLLGLLQREAQFIDLVHEDIDRHTDSEIGAAARAFLLNCRSVIRNHFDVSPTIDGQPGDWVTLNGNVDRSRMKISGLQPPASGSVDYMIKKTGWTVTRCKLPELSPEQKPAVLEPAHFSREPVNHE